jgi:hypothetical protein
MYRTPGILMYRTPGILMYILRVRVPTQPFEKGDAPAPSITIHRLFQNPKLHAQFQLYKAGRAAYINNELVIRTIINTSKPLGDGGSRREMYSWCGDHRLLGV